MKKSMYLILIFLFALSFVPNILAQEVSFSISPPLYHVVSKQDKTITIPFTVVNYGDPTLVTVTPYRLIVSDSDGRYGLAPYLSDNTKSPQISFEDSVQEPFLLLSKQAYDGVVTLTIPAGTPQEDYYYSIIAETQGSKGFETSSAIELNGGVGMNVFVSVSNSGNTEKDVSLSQLGIDPLYSLEFKEKKIQFVDSGSVLPVQVTLINKGKNATKLNGSVNLTPAVSWLPYQEYSIAIPRTLILAHEQRDIEVPDISGLYLGMYTVNASLDLEGSHVIYEQTSFVVFPFTIFGLLILSISILILIIIIYKRYTKT